MIGLSCLYWPIELLERTIECPCYRVFSAFLPTASTMACLLPFSDLHDCNAFDMGRRRYMPLTGVTLLPSSFARTSLIGYKLRMDLHDRIVETVNIINT
jgi:hypothetical protein